MIVLNEYESLKEDIDGRIGIARQYLREFILYLQLNNPRCLSCKDIDIDDMARRFIRDKQNKMLSVYTIPPPTDSKRCGKWTDQHERTLANMLENGASYADIAAHLNRTVPAIENRVSRMKASSHLFKGMKISNTVSHKSGSRFMYARLKPVGKVIAEINSKQIHSNIYDEILSHKNGLEITPRFIANIIGSYYVSLNIKYLESRASAYLSYLIKTGILRRVSRGTYKFN